MEQCDDRTCTKLDISESNPDIDHDKDTCDNDGKDRVCTHLTADCTADILFSDIRLFKSVLLH